MIDQNTLSQWMNFYKQNGLGGPAPQPTSMWGGAGLGADQNQMALQFALRMAGQNQSPNVGMPKQQDYFSGLSGPQPGVQIGDNPYSARVNQLLGAQAQVPQAPQMGNNYLARMLQR